MGFDEESTNILSVYLSGPCFGDTTPTHSPSYAASQMVEKQECQDEGRFDAHRASQPYEYQDDELEYGEDESPGHRSQRLPAPAQTVALIDFGDEGDAGAYDSPSAKQPRVYVHEDLLDLSFNAPVQQAHEDLMDIEFEGYSERQTSDSTFSTAFQAPKQQPGMYAFSGEGQDSQEIFEPHYDLANPSSSPAASDGSFYGAEVDELDDDDVTNDVAWPDAQWGNRIDNCPSSSPPQIFSSSPGFPSSQTSVGVHDEGLLDRAPKVPEEERHLSPLFVFKTHLRQIYSTEIKARNFQGDTRSPAETYDTVGDSSSPRGFNLEDDVSGSELPCLDGQEIQEDIPMDETLTESDAGSDSNEGSQRRGAVPPLSSPLRDALNHPGVDVVPPLVPSLCASASGDDEGYAEETRDIAPRLNSLPPAVDEADEAAQLDASSGIIGEQHMSVQSPRFGNVQDAESDDDETRNMAPSSSSIPGDLRDSTTKSMRYGRDLDNHPAEQIEDFREDPVSSELATTPADDHDSPLPPGGLDAPPKTGDSRVLRAEAPPHNVTDKEEEEVAGHDGGQAQIEREDSREPEDVDIGNKPTTDGYGHGAMHSTFKLPAMLKLFDKDTALIQDHVGYDDSSVFSGYQEPQGLDAHSGSGALPEFTDRPEAKPLGEPGTQVDASILRPLKPVPSRATAAAVERESPRRSILLSVPKPKRTTAAGQLLQHKRLSKPFRCPTVSNPPTTESGAAHRPGPPQPPLAQAKQEDQISSYPQVEGPSRDDAKIKHRTRRAAAQFKSPLTTVLSGQQALIRPTPTIQALERRVQTLKRANRAVEDEEEATLQALIAKWTEAGREVAYELWTMVKDSPGESSSSGRAMCGDLSRKRKVEEGWGWDDGNERNKLKMDSGSTSSLGWGDPAPGGDAEHAVEGERHDASEEHDDEERGAVQNNIGTMLMQLGICPTTLGWDEEEGCFVD